eukprot:1524214-Amphidinium_carterae.1
MKICKCDWACCICCFRLFALTPGRALTLKSQSSHLVNSKNVQNSLPAPILSGSLNTLGFYAQSEGAQSVHTLEPFSFIWVTVATYMPTTSLIGAACARPCTR